ncbi:hypothetical protein EVAR_55781_1 [Eumeta japonica]|uniref:Uncharacterized protein n=1 Tax=Eumeta variegata TaxID=151549 RepID=A0A4C1YQL7_EUMVA|nr:hypothetical protein EVAR_55781_1 [Eumeta japonica]
MRGARGAHAGSGVNGPARHVEARTAVSTRRNRSARLHVYRPPTRNLAPLCWRRLCTAARSASVEQTHNPHERRDLCDMSPAERRAGARSGAHAPRAADAPMITYDQKRHWSESRWARDGATGGDQCAACGSGGWRGVVRGELTRVEAPHRHCGFKRACELRRCAARASLRLESPSLLRLGVTLKSVTLGNVTMSHRTREARRMPCVSPPTMIGLRAQH